MAPWQIDDDDDLKKAQDGDMITMECRSEQELLCALSNGIGVLVLFPVIHN